MSETTASGSPFGSLTVIVNPHAGRRKVAEEIPNLEQTLREKGLEYRMVLTQGPGDATRFAREAIRAGGRYLVAVGGDGTVNEVVNGMFDVETDRPLAEDLVLGVVAAGSGCDLVRTFNLPGDATKACAHLTGDATYDLDVGKVTFTDADGDERVRYFANIAEAGLGAAVARAADRMSARWGQSKYFFAFWRVLPRFKLAQVRVQADRKVYEGPAFQVVVGNCQFYGGAMRISPRSYPGDGVLDVLVFKGPKSDAFTIIPKVYKGTHIPNDHIEELRAKAGVKIESDHPLPIEADGEVLGTTPARFTVVPQAIRFKL